MESKKFLVLVVIGVVLMYALLAAGAPDKSDNSGNSVPGSGTNDAVVPDAAFIKFDGVDGEAQDRDHKGWCDLLSFSQGISNPMMDTRIEERQIDPTFGDIVITKQLDKSSPKLAEACASGTTFATVKIHLTEPYTGMVSMTFYTYELKNVIITGYSAAGGGDDVPMESISLNFEEIKVTYTQYDAKGTKVGTTEYDWTVESTAS